MKQEHPRPEIIGNYRVVYPIFREDLAEAILTPLPAAPEKAPAKLSAPPAEQKGQQ